MFISQCDSSDFYIFICKVISVFSIDKKLLFSSFVIYGDRVACRNVTQRFLRL